MYVMAHSVPMIESLHSGERNGRRGSESTCPSLVITSPGVSRTHAGAFFLKHTFSLQPKLESIDHAWLKSIHTDCFLYFPESAMVLLHKQ